MGTTNVTRLLAPVETRFEALFRTKTRVAVISTLALLILGAGAFTLHYHSASLLSNLPHTIEYISFGAAASLPLYLAIMRCQQKSDTSYAKTLTKSKTQTFMTTLATVIFCAGLVFGASLAIHTIHKSNLLSPTHFEELGGALTALTALVIRRLAKPKTDIETTFPEFTLGREIAEGNDARIFRAKRNGKPVALKLFKKPKVYDINKGAHLIHDVHVKGIVKVKKYYVVRDDTHQLVDMPQEDDMIHGHVMSYKEGYVPVSTNRNPLIFATLKPKMTRILKKLHEADFVHGDISTSNFLYHPTTQKVVLIDFDQAQVATEPLKTNELACLDDDHLR